MADGEAGGRTRVALAGWIGSTNLGDELIARAVCRQLSDLGAEPVAITIDLERTADLLGTTAVEHHRVRDTPDLVRLLRTEIESVRPSCSDHIRLASTPWMSAPMRRLSCKLK